MGINSTTIWTIGLGLSLLVHGVLLSRLPALNPSPEIGKTTSRYRVHIFSPKVSPPKTQKKAPRKKLKSVKRPSKKAIEKVVHHKTTLLKMAKKERVSRGIITQPTPEYPFLARRKGWEGLVRIGFHLTDNGIPTQLKIIQSSGFQVLDLAALKALKNWRFEPGQAQDQVQSIQFSLR